MTAAPVRFLPADAGSYDEQKRPVYFQTPGGGRIDSVGLPLLRPADKDKKSAWEERHLTLASGPATAPSAAAVERTAALLFYSSLLINLVVTVILYGASTANGAASIDVIGPQLGRVAGQAILPSMNQYWPQYTQAGQISGVSAVDDANAAPGAPRSAVSVPASLAVPRDTSAIGRQVSGVVVLLLFGALAAALRPEGADRQALWQSTVDHADELRWLLAPCGHGQRSRSGPGHRPRHQRQDGRMVGSSDSGSLQHHGAGVKLILPSLRTAGLILSALALPVFMAASLIHGLTTVTGVFPTSAYAGSATGTGTGVAGSGPGRPELTWGFFASITRFTLDLMCAYMGHRLVEAASPSWHPVGASMQFYC